MKTCSELVEMLEEMDSVKFEKDRLGIYAHLGLFAPLKVIHRYDKIMDYLLDVD